MVKFSTKHLTPPPLVGKKTKNYLRAMKRILYDMGVLTLVRWLLQRIFKFEPPFGPGSKLKRVPPHQKIEKNNCVLKELLCKFQCLKPMFSLLFLFLSEKLAVVDTPYHLSGKFHYFFEPFP